ncbi:hypothetical protein JRQ81_011502 [Phrynocephalus forsythii]|uniref:Uncharacterized protein n=1 Tax=Phrynocephalus forsythii TaxID=171643 RepID=A0A9Q1AQK2_9SAUR|nr:hypothetical protein JRQ81_011502 [Phrynocephalus forsythii]
MDFHQALHLASWPDALWVSFSWPACSLSVSQEEKKRFLEVAAAAGSLKARQSLGQKPVEQACLRNDPTRSDNRQNILSPQCSNVVQYPTNPQTVFRQPDPPR